jgi:hypothetical protein
MNNFQFISSLMRNAVHEGLMLLRQKLEINIGYTYPFLACFSDSQTICSCFNIEGLAELMELEVVVEH